MVGASSLAENEPEAEAASRAKKAASHSGRLLVRMPGELHGELARAAGEERVSLNQFITGVLARAVDWQSEDEAPGGRVRPWRRRASREATWLVLALNVVVVLVAAVAAITLLVLAL